MVRVYKYEEEPPKDGQPAGVAADPEAFTPFIERQATSAGDSLAAALQAQIEALKEQHAQALEQTARDAHAKGYDEGKTVGLEEGEAQGRSAVMAEAEQQIAAAVSAHEQAVKAVLDNIAVQFGAAVEHAATTKQQTLHHLADLAMIIASKIAGEALEANAAEAIKRDVLDMLETLHSEPEVSLTVASDLVAPLQSELDALARRAGFQGSTHVDADPAMQAGDYHIRWKQGEAVRDRKTLINALTNIMNRFDAAEEVSAAATAMNQLSETDSLIDAPVDTHKAAETEMHASSPPSSDAQPPDDGADTEPRPAPPTTDNGA